MFSFCKIKELIFLNIEKNILKKEKYKCLGKKARLSIGSLQKKKCK